MTGIWPADLMRRAVKAEAEAERWRKLAEDLADSLEGVLTWTMGAAERAEELLTRFYREAAKEEK